MKNTTIYTEIDEIKDQKEAIRFEDWFFIASRIQEKIANFLGFSDNENEENE